MRERIGARMRTGGTGRRRFGAHAVLAVLLAAGGVTAASAQQLPAPPPPAQDDLTAESVGSGWVVAPDFKFTRVDDTDAALVGGYGGKIIDRRFLVGGGAYWLGGAPYVDMAYGGGLVEWFGNPGGLIDFSVRGFVGLGTATLSDGPFVNFDDGMFDFDEGLFDLDNGLFDPDDKDKLFGDGRNGDGRRGGMSHRDAGAPFVVGGPGNFAGDWDLGWPDELFGGFGTRQNFFVAEPQASIHLNLTPWVRIGGGAGYRLIGRGGDYTERLRGLTANVGVQIGPRSR